MTVLNNPNRVAFLSAEQSDPNATADELLRHTGFARCADCQYVMRAESLTSLPEHYCAQRQQRKATA